MSFPAPLIQCCEFLFCSMHFQGVVITGDLVRKVESWGHLAGQRYKMLYFPIASNICGQNIYVESFIPKLMVEIRLVKKISNTSHNFSPRLSYIWIPGHLCKWGLINHGSTKSGHRVVLLNDKNWYNIFLELFTQSVSKIYAETSRGGLQLPVNTRKRLPTSLSRKNTYLE